MRVVFLGTPDFAVPSLKVLLTSSYEVVAVFCQPDKPSGRGHKLQAPPIKLQAQNAGIPIFQPDKIRAQENQPIFECLRPDFIVVVAYGQILPGWLLQAARIAPVNVHASLLPAYRGAAPITWAILNGETTSGITTMIMEETLDTGPILLKREIPIPSDMTRGELSAVLAEEAANLLIPTLNGLREGTLERVPQNSSLATWAPRIQKEMALIAWDQNAAAIHNKVRAFYPWPIAFTSCGDLKVQICKTALVEPSIEAGRPPGTFLAYTKTGFLIQCGAGTRLEVLELQPASRKRMSGRDFAVGNRIVPNLSMFPPSR
jgi:methionyl-tRNA formyltransferase